MIGRNFSLNIVIDIANFEVLLAMVMALAVIGLDGQGALWKNAVDLVESVHSFQGNRLCRRELPSLVPISFYSFTFSCLRRGLFLFQLCYCLYSCYH